MQPITINDPAWYTTFPHIVAPLKDEWLVGLMLRCDQVNIWESGATLAYLLDASYTSRLTRGFRLLKEEHLAKLAGVLALPLASIVATTYQAELARLYEGADQHPQLSRSRLPFHICPLCVAEDRRLSRWLTLPGISHCPQHQILLIERCQCGNPLLPFDRYTLPYTCFGCNLNWARLPRVSLGQGQLEGEGRRLTYYELFLTKGSPALLANALQLCADKQEMPAGSRNKTSIANVPTLEYIVDRLMELDISADNLGSCSIRSRTPYDDET